MGQVYLFNICRRAGPGDLSYTAPLLCTTNMIRVLINHIIVTFYRVLTVVSSRRGAWLTFPREFLFLKTASKDTNHLLDLKWTMGPVTFRQLPDLNGFLSTVWTLCSFWSILIKHWNEFDGHLILLCFLSGFRTPTNWNCNGLVPSPPTQCPHHLPPEGRCKSCHAS